MRYTKILEKFGQYKDKIPRKELDEFFDSLEPVAIDEFKGEWQVKFLFTKEGTGSKLETFIRVFPVFRVYGKKFLGQDKVKAWIYRISGIKFSILGASAVLRKVEFRNKLSTSMVYNYLPLIDNFRKIDEFTIMGVMEIKGETALYFYLKK